MPEHSPALIWPTPEVNPPQTVQELEDRTALFILFWNDASVLATDTVR